MDVHQAWRGVGDLEQRVAGGRHFAEARAEHDQQVGVLDRPRRAWLDADAGAADIAAMAVVDVVLVAKGARDRQIEAVGEGLQAFWAAVLQPGPPTISSGRWRLGQLLCSSVKSAARRPASAMWAGLASLGLALGRQHVLRQAQHDRARPAGARHMVGVAHIFGDALGLADDGGPLHEGAEQPLDLDFLKGLAVLVPARGHADEGNHGRRVLLGDVQPAHGVGGAGPARDEADAGLAGDLAPGLRHHRGAALLPADDGLDAVAVVQAVERGKKAFARHGKSGAGALRLELVDQDLAAVPHAMSPR